MRCAFWIGVNLASRGEMGRASGWLGRAQRLLEREGRDRVERGYLLLPVVFQQEAKRRPGAAAATAGEAAAIGERFGDPDLFALAAHEHGHILIRLGRIKEGLALLDEAMVAVTAGELSPIVAGIVYCGVILACQDAHEVRRAQEWTAALTRWCERQPDLVAFTGRCLVHRAEIMQLHGAWPEALEEARRAASAASRRRTRPQPARPATGRARSTACSGSFGAAEEAYREASRRGREPQPGLALLRLAQGTDRRRRGRDPQGAGGDRRAGRSARAFCPRSSRSCWRSTTSRRRAAPAASSRRSPRVTRATRSARWPRRPGAPSSWPRATPAAALASLRHARQSWQELEAPYEAARVRELVGLACRELGDEDTATLELDAARASFAELGAAPDLARVESLAERRARDSPWPHRARARGAAPSSPPARPTRRSPPSSC